MTLSESEKEWVADVAARNDVPETQVAQWYEDAKESLKAMKAAGTPDEEITSFVRGATMGQVNANRPVPDTEFEVMIIGHYPIRKLQASGKLVGELIGYASLDGGVPESAIMTMWEDEVIKRTQYVPLSGVKTGFTYDESKKVPGKFLLSTQMKTILNVESEISWVPPDIADRHKMLQDNTPVVKLGNAMQNISSSINTGSSSITNVLDLKRIVVNVVDYKDGTRQDGIDWAYYAVVDDSPTSNIRNRNFMVWIDPIIPRNINAGPGSILEIIGNINLTRDGMPQMNACYVNPIVIKGMSAATNIQKDGVNVPTSAQQPAIKLFTPDGA